MCNHFALVGKITARFVKITNTRPLFELINNNFKNLLIHELTLQCQYTSEYYNRNKCSIIKKTRLYYSHLLIFFSNRVIPLSVVIKRLSGHKSFNNEYKVKR